MSISCTHRIFKASRRGDVQSVRRLQKLLIKSQAAKLLAIRLKWGINRHRNKGTKWVINKYFKSIGDRNWVFASRTRDNPFPTCLISHQDTKIKRFVKVKGDASPYDGNLVYWSTRQGKHPEMPTRTAIMLKKQKGRCNWCKLYFKDGDVIELDHIIPKSKGGKDEYKNWQLLHRHCHDQKTSVDGSLVDILPSRDARDSPQPIISLREGSVLD